MMIKIRLVSICLTLFRNINNKVFDFNEFWWLLSLMMINYRCFPGNVRFSMMMACQVKEQDFHTTRLMPHQIYPCALRFCTCRGWDCQYMYHIWSTTRINRGNSMPIGAPFPNDGRTCALQRIGCSKRSCSANISNSLESNYMLHIAQWCRWLKSQSVN